MGQFELIVEMVSKNSRFEGKNSVANSEAEIIGLAAS
jgi:hypothetical protein